MSLPLPAANVATSVREAALRAALAEAEARATALGQQLAEAEARARLRENQLLALLGTLPAGMVLVDPAGRIEIVNDQFRQLFGLAPGSVLATTHAPHSPNEVSIGAAFREPEAFNRRAWGLHEAGQTARGEQFELADGRRVELDYLVLDQHHAGRLICYRDVTEHHQRSVQLQRLSRIPQQNPYPVLCVGPGGELLYANNRGQGIARELAAGRAPWAPQLLTLVRQALASETPQHQELAIDDRYYHCAAKPLAAEGYATVFFTDITARYHAEQQLAEQRAFYETILEQVPVAVGVLDADLRFVYQNPQSQPSPELRRQTLGLTIDELGHLMQRPAAVRERRQHYLAQALRERRTVRWEESFHNLDQPLSLLINSTPVFDAAQQLRYVIMSSIDITTRRAAEQQVAEQRSFYEAILNHLPVELAVLDAGQRFLFVNPAVGASPDLRARMLQMSYTDYLGETGRSAPQIQARMRYFAQTTRSGEEVRWEEDALTGHGPRRMLRSLRAAFNPDQTVRLVVGSSIDITDRYRAEEQLRQSEARLRGQQDFVRAIVDALPSAVYVITPDGQVQFYNAAFAALTARSQHMLPAAEQPDAVRQQVAEVAGWRQQVVATGRPLDAELPLLLSSGEICYLQVHMRPMPRPEGDIEVLVVSSDITALKAARQAAEANAQAKEAFLARMSHEIRTPLNGVLGMLQLLRKTPLTPEQHDYLLTMQRSGRHLLALINDVLDLAKITARHLELDVAPFDLPSLLQGAGETVATLAAQKDLALLIEPAPLAGPHLLGDAYRLQQVLLNLLSNAIKFTGQGGVRLGASLLAQTPDHVRLRFWVQDTGLGIAPAQQERVFDSFAQASANTSAHFGGTGLGLAISEQLVQQMGGVLHLCSEVGSGTTFSFVLALPRVPGAALPEPAPAAPVALAAAGAAFEGLHGLRVLLAEDNAVNQWIARSLLEYWGVRVHAVGNGTEALALLTSDDFDAALLDIRMPGLSGVEVAAALRNYPHPRRAAIPLIALTANAFEADRISYLSVGMNCCVTKPFEEAELCDWLLRLTRGAAAATAGE